ncbi:hypothetical protein B5X24_HaOG210520 [Helicoverpa armigera]|uniref:Endonuclease/exonuclease/phosphatase domain-containing protein n=1 Tax=Helicoverpa armigera TaxID=29058 RepID=A0A2W1BGL1_HELAM|nr:hypothetical protein B5X24_HaOG210520 [Helicoverpa armigera]
MEGQFQVLFEKMQLEMAKQTNLIFERMDERLEPLIKENKIMKSKIEALEKKIDHLEKDQKKNNILVFGLEENEKSTQGLLQTVQNIIRADSKISIEKCDVSKIHRIGIKTENKIRPVVITFANYWKRIEVLKTKRHLKQIYVTEDFPKDVLEKRRELKPKLIEERAKGKTAYLKYDQLIIKDGYPSKEKRKRDQSTSPDNQNHAKNNRKQTNPNPAGPRGVVRPSPPRVISPYKISNKICDKKLYQKRNNNLYVATLNVRTLLKDFRLEELEHAIKAIKWDIIGLCEVRRSGEEIREYNDYIFYHFGEKQGIYGIGFVVKKYLKNNIISFEGITERIAILNIQLPGLKQLSSIIQVHAPGEKDSKTAKDIFYNDLTRAMQSVNKHILLVGDFNAQIGSKSNKDEFVLGNYSSGYRNDNGQRLVNFSYAYNLKIMNSFYKKRKSRKWTWISPNGRDKNEIDFILTNQKQFFNDVSVINKLNFNTDHRMVRANIKCDQKKSRKFVVASRVLSLTQSALTDLENKISNIGNYITLQERYDAFEKSLKSKTQQVEYGSKLSPNSPNFIRQQRDKQVKIPFTTIAVR